jgi:hypothetical protein
MALKHKINEEGWRQEFLCGIGKQLRSRLKQELLTPSGIGKEVEQNIGFPAELWVKISGEAWPMVTGDEDHGHCFRAGMVLGWVEARKRYDKEWKPK